MSLINEIITKNSSETPLERLSQSLAQDMKSVDAMIMKKMRSPVPLVQELAAYLIASGGKRIRPLMTLASTALYGGDMERAHGLATAVEFIHSATLLHDDVVDNSAERRGQRSANIVFGNEASVLVGDFLFSRAFELMVEDGSLDVLRVLAEASAIIAQGEVLQLSLQGRLDTTMEDYLDVIKGKTAALFAAACEVGPLVSGAQPSDARALCEYGLNLGIAFQIADDVLDYKGDSAQLGKSIGDDFREGKMTAPVLLAIERGTQEERVFWERTLARREQTDADLPFAQSLILQHNAIEDGLSLAMSYAQKAREALAEAPDSDLRAILDDLALYVVDRDA